MSHHESPADPSIEPASDATSGTVAAARRQDKRPRDPESWGHLPMHKYRKARHSHEFRPDAGFFALADVVVAADRTLLGYDRLYAFWQAIRNLAGVPGVAAEVGSFRGGSAYFIAGALRSLLGEDVPLHVFDTFAGHPAAAISPPDNFHQPGQFGDNDFDEVREYLSPFPQITFHRGDAIESLKTLPDMTYRLVHLDTDLYLPTKVGLEYFEPRLSRGGVIMLDDYASKRCEGVRAAAVEYLDTTDAFQVWDLRTEQLMLVKR